MDSAGNLYVTDQYNNTIRKITPIGADWAVSTVGGVALQSGTNNGAASDARFKKPWGLAVNTDGRLFIVDYSNQTIREGVPGSGAPPWLTMSRSGTNVILTWPLSAGGFVLESSDSLPPNAAWIAQTNGIVISGNNFRLARNVGPGSAFYRLRAR
jgi:hypothetical protein